jgi:hypothetical protein
VNLICAVLGHQTRYSCQCDRCGAPAHNWQDCFCRVCPEKRHQFVGGICTICRRSKCPVCAGTGYLDVTCSSCHCDGRVKQSTNYWETGEWEEACGGCWGRWSISKCDRCSSFGTAGQKTAMRASESAG